MELAAIALVLALPAPPFAFADDFDSSLCVGSCAGAAWAIRQQEDGLVTTAPAPGRWRKAPVCRSPSIARA